MDVRITHAGTAMMLLEIGGLRILTDPVFDPPGRRYSFGFGTSSVKLTAPSIEEKDLGRIDAVLLCHDHHADNLDDLGRAFLPRAGQVLTTASGAKRLGGNARGLSPWETAVIEKDGFRVEVIATPARHGPIGSRPFVGEVTGFMLRWDGQKAGPLYVSGDTVWFGGIEEIARRFRPSLAVLHLAAVRFGISGPLRYTFDAKEAVLAANALGAHTVVPIHYEGWTHFTQGKTAIERVFADAKIAERVRWLPLGEPVVFDV